jgi:ADP-ribose pyrophosphatase YjhB (NUDIX family)
MDMREQLAALYERYGTPALTNFRLEDLTGGDPYAAGVFTLADANGEVVLIRRTPHADHPGLETFWWLPGGEWEPDETLDEAAVREFREETGLEVALERLLVALIREERFLMLWFRGQVIAGGLSPDGDPTHSTAEVKSFAPADISVEGLRSSIDKIVLAYEGFIDYPLHDLLTRHGLQAQPVKGRPIDQDAGVA